MATDNDRPLELPILKQPADRYKQRETQTRPRDPRFDPKCSGSNDPRHFAKNYAFLDEIRQGEIEQLERALRKERDGSKKDQIRITLNRLRNKLVENRNKQKRLEVIGELRTATKRNYVHKAPSTHEKAKLVDEVCRREHIDQRHSDNPISTNTVEKKRRVVRNKFVKKSDIKKKMLVEKYTELKETGKLTKYLERKRKKLISRDESKLR